MIDTTSKFVHKLHNPGTDSTLYIDERTGESEINRAEPHFFRTPHGKRETYHYHRGQLIVRNTVTFTGCKPQRRTTLYLFVYDPEEDHWFTLCTGSDWSGIKAAERAIDRMIESGVRED